MLSTSLFDVTGKKALVTGGATGIGRASAIALALGGADVAIVGRNEGAAAQTVASISALGRRSLFVHCDVRDPQQVDAMLDVIMRRFERLDIAVNSAGIYRGGADEAQSKQDWDEVIDTNLTGIWLCARAQMRQMIRQAPVEGKIINIASIAGCVACSNGAYDASKAAVVHLTRTLAARWGRYNINVNCISPGFVGRIFGAIRSDDERRRIREVTPLGHVQRLRDLYGPILFLASSASDYVTGQNLIVDGGHTLSSWPLPSERSVPPRVDPPAETIEPDD
jgi:NAD(P)-dependent dehydrogenase (short-subunit alcohol dehydrogenase family)